MKIRRKLLIALMLVIGAAFLPTHVAMADCQVVSSTGEDDSVICMNPADPNGIYTGNGNDKVEVYSTTSVSNPTSDTIITYYGNDRVINRGIINSGKIAVHLGYGGDYLSNRGTITGTVAAAMCFPQTGLECKIYNYGSMTSESEETVDFVGAGGSGRLINEGTITANTQEAVHFFRTVEARLTNRGTIYGRRAAVEFGETRAFVYNYGTISSHAEEAIGSQNGNDQVFNYSTGYVSSQNNPAIMTGPGDDLIKNFGTVFARQNVFEDAAIEGGTGRDVIENSGNIDIEASYAAIEGGTGSDVIMIRGGAVNGLINGDAYSSYAAGDWDILAFQFTSSDQAEMDAFVATVRSQTPAGGSVVWRGNTYTWAKFEEIKVFFNGVRVADAGQGVAVAAYAPVEWSKEYLGL